ncbi:hypothetical protein KBD18_00185 [Patescibacteria group bacterium]|nr:hypothetical protein [Patescibacteria group bacterium]
MADISGQTTNIVPLDQAREPEIHVMPEKFFGVAVRASLPPVARPAPQVSALPTPGATVAAEQRGPGKGLLIAAALIVVLLGVIAVAIWYPRSKTPAQPAIQPANRNTNTPPVRPATTSTPVVATSTPPAVASSTPPVDNTPLRNATDRDADGLTDVEEREIYGTDPANADTDVDGYLDGGEVFYLYNPAAIAPVTLRESGIVRVVNEPVIGVSTLIPLSWTRRTIANGVVFTGASGEFIQITTEANPLGLSLSAWYRQSPAQNTDGTPVTFSNRLGAVGLKSLDGLQAFFANGSRVHVVSYGTAGTRELSYRRTFEMLLNSFAMTAAVSTPDPQPATSASSSAVATTSTPSSTASGTAAIIAPPAGNTATSSSTTTIGAASSTP